MKDYVPKAQAAIKAAGGKFLAAGGKTTTIEGEPPKARVVIQQWDSVEKIQAYRDSAAFKDLLPLRNSLAKFRTYAVEGYLNSCSDNRRAGLKAALAGDLLPSAPPNRATIQLTLLGRSSSVRACGRGDV